MSILDIVFPKRCVSCRSLGRYICDACRKEIEYIKFQICPVCSRSAIDGLTHPGCKTKYALDGLISFFRYKSVIQKAIKAIKYRLVYDLSRELISLIPYQDSHNLNRIMSNNAVLVSISLHPSRIKQRGFNQAEVLGKELSCLLNVPFKNNLLKRIKKTVPQTEMKDREERLKNMQNVFEIDKLQESLPAKIILFDDVYTTGATLRSAANVLKRAGVKYVFGITLAHG